MVADSTDNHLLPEAADRDAIVTALAELVVAGGYEHAVLSPLLEPTPRYFPDRWAGGEASVHRIVQRLLIYADLADLHVITMLEEDVGLGPLTAAGIGSPAWLAPRRPEAPWTVVVRVSSLREPLVLVPALARAVAHIWRRHHNLASDDTLETQRRIDLTALYLGFGLLTVPAAVRHGVSRTGGRPQSTVSRLGVVDPRSLAFAFAALIAVRGLPSSEVTAIRSRLGDTAGPFFSAGLEHLQKRDTALARRLTIPDRATWSAPPDVEDLLSPLPDVDLPEETRRDEDRGVIGMNAGAWVFRVERTKAQRLARTLGLPVVLLGMLAARQGIEVPMWMVAGVAGILALVGLGVGRLLPDSRCSEPKCGEPLDPSLVVCPRCGGRIGGVIHHPKERLAAAERLGNVPPEHDTDHN